MDKISTSSGIRMKQIIVYAFDKDDRFRFNFTVTIEVEIYRSMLQKAVYEEQKLRAEAKQIIDIIGKNFKRNSHGAHFKRIKTLRYDGKEIRL